MKETSASQVLCAVWLSTTVRWSQKIAQQQENLCDYFETTIHSAGACNLQIAAVLMGKILGSG